MGNTTRIPRAISRFDTYLENATRYLQAGSPETNASRLSIQEEEVTTLNGYYAEWSPLYLLYSDKKNSRTTAVTEQLHLIIEKTVDYDHQQHLLDRIASSPNVTVTDLDTFNIKGSLLAKTKRTKPSKAITELVLPDISQRGGGELAIKCRNSEGGRAAILKEANCVEYRYRVDEQAPTSVNNEGLNTGISTKASFTLSLGAENSAKYAYLYFRWYNTKYPNLAGPWSSLHSVLIL
ncbi:hypothetical protein C8N47_10389 [Mangrovibacterium marinum]|uniref:Uncharacterized protein n=1 Tax=Mangrovibacterium marinum TaxID=1639118 RepID=A0A2T5C4I8_9BACT|nr:hypothetical protein [Mangrovibacterium marinum]PTN09795.1 hypothetical protein C8N47_10389 [Mangrovibacterium marinum]